MPAISARRESRARHPARAARRLAVAGLAALALVLSGCATHPPATSLPRPVTHALPQD
ncbi:phospholipase D family protein, partial [Burkholderia gladioli]|nr:phospholipase D family protein [Burkholderia gladioli]